MSTTLKDPGSVFNKNTALYILDGEEYYIKKLALEEIRKQVLGENKDPFSYQEITPANWEDGKTFETHLCQASLFSRRMVVVSYFSEFSGKIKGEILDVLSSSGWITGNNETIAVIISHGRVDLSGGAAWTKNYRKLTSSKTAAHFMAYALDARDIEKWIEKFFGEKDKKISQSVCSMLISSTDGTLDSIKKEAEKLSLFVGEKDQIELSDVNECVGDFRIISVFDFCDAALFCNKTAARIYLSRIVEESASGWEVMLISRLWWSYKRNLSIKGKLSSGADEYAVSNTFNAPYKKKREIISNVKKLSSKAFKKQLQLLFELEYKIKGAAPSALFKRNYFEQFISSLPRILID